MSAQLPGTGQPVIRTDRPDGSRRRDDVIVGHWLADNGTMSAHARGAPCWQCDGPAALVGYRGRRDVPDGAR